ncbi:MAG: HpcH/HpaI aldolase/citrate lyase family protein [Sphingomonadaceae bacterium]
MYRSWLSVPANHQKKLASLASLHADAVILDLGDSVAPQDKDEARQNARQWLAGYRSASLEGEFPSPSRWVRISGLNTPYWRDDLVAIMPGGPHGIILSHTQGPNELQTLAAELYELEQVHQLEHESVRLIAQIGDSPKSALTISHLVEKPHSRIAGLCWSPSSLVRSLGATRSCGMDGQWTDTMRYVRAHMLLTARAAGVMAIDMPSQPANDIDQLILSARASRADGFTGMMAFHPRQIEPINTIFDAGPKEVMRAEAIIALFAQTPDAVAVMLDGQLITKDDLSVARMLITGDARPLER